MSTALASLSKDLGDTVEALQAAVVRVEGRQRFPASGWVWSEDGLVVTANHVVKRDEGIRIASAGTDSLQAELIGRDPQRDLALLKAPVNGTQAQPAAHSSEVKVGHLVLALGRPGASVMATLGILSSLDAGMRSGRQAGYLQTDVVMYPGFSGGPLVSSEGEILGMNTSGILRGVSLAVPVERVKRSVEAILDHGSVRQGYLGVTLQPVRLSPISHGELDQESGLMIVGVEEGSPAARQGLLQGDVIVQFNDEAIQQLDDLFIQLSDEQIGQAAKVVVVRGGALTELKVEVGER